MAEPLWPGGPTLNTDPIRKPTSKRFTRLDQAHAALGIKDDDDEEFSEIDRRLGLAPISRKQDDKNVPNSILGGSTGSTTQSSSYTSSTCPSSTEGSVYGGVVLRHVSPEMRHVSPEMRHVSPQTRHVSPEMRHVSLEMRQGSPQTLPRSAYSTSLSESSDSRNQVSELGEESRVKSSVIPPKPARQRSATVNTMLPGDKPSPDLLEKLPEQPNPRLSSKLFRGVSLDVAPGGGPAKLLRGVSLDPGPAAVKENKRKRYSSADFLTRNSLVKLKEEKKKSMLGVEQGDVKKKNRFSVLYNSMRGSKRREDKDSTISECESSKPSSTSDPPDAKTLRLLEEKMCDNPEKLLADRVRELRKVGDPELPKIITEEREDFPLFEFVCEVSLRRKSENFCPYISWSHPPLRVLEDDELAAITLNIPTFCFPDMDTVEPVKKMKTETYCFVFTDLQAQNKFGYCRRFLPAAKNQPPEKRFPVVYCMVTKLRSFETFSKIFDQVVALRNFSSAGAYSFLKALIEQNAPKPGKTVTVKYINPKIGNLVDIHVKRVTSGKRFEHVDLAYVLTKLGSKLLVEIFVNLLVERKLLFVAESLSDLTRIIHSIMQLLYPLQWQGIYIPVLPQEILDAVSSPVPFVIGILKEHAKTLDEEALDDECNLVYIADKRIVKLPNFTDIPFNKKFRKKFLQDLKLYKGKLVKSEQSPDHHTAEIGDMFYQFMKTIIGHYGDHVTFDENGESDLDLTSFSDAAGVHSEFVWQLSKTQMFSYFYQTLTTESKNVFEDIHISEDAG